MPTVKRLLAVSSSGGHWVQLQRLRPAFEGCQVCFATTRDSYRHEVEGYRFELIRDANRTQPFKAVLMLFTLARVLLKFRPHVVVSTGAMPGYFALRLAKLFGARTVWVDSIANAEELSLSGQKAGKVADLWLTQWEHLAQEKGPSYRGNVLG
ncbi:glycosyltransferase [Nibricoccus sp. IMCC34717]|uniref:glycosyltransferase n=1 Tax=Nibricoccus sp. IMCC34717 TaxID=3034021 RepID=UPI00384F1874